MRPRERGIALVAVLWGVVLLSLMTAGVVALTRAENQRTSLEHARARQSLALEAALGAVIQQLTTAPPSRRSLLAGGPYHYEHDGMALDVFLEFESGRIDLNAANDPLLKALFQSAGASMEEAERWVARLRDWQDADDERRLNGEEAGEYRAAGKPYGPRNGPLKSLAELRLLLGMSDPLYGCVADAATVYTQADAPNDAYLVPGARRAWMHYREAQHLESIPTSSAGSNDADPSGQVLRLRFVIEDSAPSRPVWVIVGRLTGDASEPWISLGRWRETRTQLSCP